MATCRRPPRGAFDNASLIDPLALRTYRANPPARMKPNRYDPIAAALKEDIGTGDITTEFFVPESLHASGRIVAREKAIVAGSGVVAEVFRRLDPSIDVQIIRGDGTEVAAGDVIIEVRGLAR